MKSSTRFVTQHPDALLEAWATRRPMRRLEIEIRLDWRCNARCKFCGVWKYSREGMLTPERWGEVLADLRDHGLHSVLFTGGEPLLYPHIFELLEHAGGLAIETAIITNGYLLDAACAKRLGRLAGLKEVTVSIDSADPAVHDRVRKRPGLFARATNGMAQMRAHAPNVRLCVNTVVSADTVAALGDLLQLPVTPDAIRVFPVGIDIAWLDELRAGLSRSWAEWASEARSQSLGADGWDAARWQITELAREAERRGITVELERLTAATPFEGECLVPLAHFIVQPDGDVYPCCHVQDPEHRIGQLSKETVEEMISGPGYQGLLERLRPARLRACRSCSRYREFNEEAQRLLPGHC
jgi:AdoMet-dependent heme synthase